MSQLLNNNLSKEFNNNFEKNASKIILKQILILLKSKTEINICLSGGTSLIKILNVISKENIDWEKCNFFLTDERVVDINNIDSNFFNIKNALRTINSLKIYPFYINGDIKKSIKNYKDLFNKKLNATKTFDLLILGVGLDGHIASIFPSYELDMNEDVYHVKNLKDQFKYDRITVGMRILAKSKNTILITYGFEKFDLIKNQLNEKHPIYQLAKYNENINWIFTKKEYE